MNKLARKTAAASPSRRQKTEVSTSKTTLRNGLQKTSTLHPLVADGFAAIKTKESGCFAPEIRSSFDDSLDLDEAMKKGREGENRWDYLLGHGPSKKIVAVEPHSAKQDEVSTVIRKRLAAIAQLRDHLRDGIHIEKWLWVTSGKVHFADTEKIRLLLDQNGIEFAGTQVSAKHLPSSSTQPAPSSKSQKKNISRTSNSMKR